MSGPRVSITHGIILKRRVRGEADRLLTVFTKEHGKCTVIAKGIRKITSKRAPYLEMFSHVTLYLAQGKMWDVVMDVKPVHTFMEFRTSLAHVSVAYYVCELVDALLPERQEHTELYEWLLGTLESLWTIAEHDLPQAQLHFSHDLLRQLGYLTGTQTLSQEAMRPYLERIMERRIRSYAFLTSNGEVCKLKIHDDLGGARECSINKQSSPVRETGK